MPFGPKNALVFHSAMMPNFKEKWDSIFTQTMRSINNLGNNTVSVTERDKIYLNKTKLVSGSRTIIDDILLLCSNLDAILIYLECVCKVLSNIKSASDSKSATLSKLESNMSAMTSLKRGTAPLNQNLTLLITGYYPLHVNNYSPSLIWWISTIAMIHILRYDWRHCRNI